MGDIHTDDKGLTFLTSNYSSDTCMFDKSCLQRLLNMQEVLLAKKTLTANVFKGYKAKYHRLLSVVTSKA